MVLNYEEVRKYLEDWGIWVSIILLIIPGMMYQIEHGSVDITEYSGTLFFVPLITSLYFSLPFFLLGSITHTLSNIGRKESGEDSFFGMSLLTVYLYLFFDIFMFSTKSNLTTSINLLLTVCAAFIILHYIIRVFNKWKNKR